jgi:hypothetical protein
MRTRQAGVRASWFAVAVLALIALAAFAATHPFGPLLPTLALIAFAVVVWLRREAWMVALFGLLPVADLAPRTGMIYWTESDALVLVVLAVFGMREARSPSAIAAPNVWAFRALPLVLTSLVASSYLVSTAWGPLADVGSDQNLLVGYDSALNGVRLAKGFLLAVALIPLLATTFRANPTGAAWALAAGLVLGLTAVGFAAFWERLSFTGLSDFSTDYRTTAAFWEMNVGGAQLDGWLALSLPFLLWLVLRERSPARLALGLALTALATYVVFTTFSRGLYLAFVVSTGVLLLSLLRRPFTGPGQGEDAHRKVRGHRLAWVFRFAFVLLFSGLVGEVFKTGGYRGMAAVLGLVATAYLIGPIVLRMDRRSRLLASFAAVVTGVGLFAVFSYVPKGPYVAYGACALVAGGLGLFGLHRREGGRGRAVELAAAAAFGAQCVAAVWVSAHWGGDAATLPAILATLLIAIPVLIAPRVASMRWAASARGIMLLALACGGVAVVVVTLNTYYSASRFETVGDDFRYRIEHWSHGVDLVASDQTALGIGTGRYATAYFWHAGSRDIPGNHRLADDAGNTYLKLGGPRHVLGFGELYRVMQRVEGNPQLPVSVKYRVRSTERVGAIRFEVCRRHLIYVQGCADKTVDVPAGGEWRQGTVLLAEGDYGPGAGTPARPVVFAVANASGQSSVEVDDLVAVDATGRTLLNNGSFGKGTERWFFSSDKHHLPWHAKNLWLHYWIEQGWLGVIAFTLLVAAAVIRVGTGKLARHPLAPPLLAGMLGFLAVGAFDSLVDAPRLTLAFFSLAFVALGLRVPDAAADAGEPTSQAL